MHTHLIFPSQTSHKERYSVPGRILPPISFEGDWTDRERRILVGAIADLEYREAPAQKYVPLPWSCICKRLSGISVYVAHRARSMHVLHAYGAIELGLKIVCVGATPPNGPGGAPA